ncbi:MAG: hypothetical protein PHR62_04685 [Paludibacter sp.]|nr:hypothetical protein [Paludibacter sp.]
MNQLAQIKAMRNIKIIIQGFALLLTLISCEKEYEHPLVYTGDVTNITDTSAFFTAKVSCLGDYKILESGFIWGAHSNDNNGIKVKNSESFNEIYSLNTNEKLLPGKTFYVRAYIQTQHSTSYGREVSFESPKGQINTGKWTQVYNDDPDIGSCKYIKTSFTINNTTYLALQGDLSTNGDLYSYNSETNTFNFEFSDPIISSASYSATYNGNAYIFCMNAFYLFNPQTKSFTKLSVLDESENKYWVSGFIIDDNLFIGLGNTSKAERYSKDFWKYNITADSWEQIASFPGDYRSQGFSFSINNLGYVGGGDNLTKAFNDFWCYIPESDKWIQKESLPFQNKEYDLFGTNTEKYGYCFYQNKLYEYNPVFDIWEKMADLDISYNLCYPHIFITGNKVSVLEVTGYEKYFKMWSYEK